MNRLRRMLVDEFAWRGVVRESRSSLEGGAPKMFRIPVAPSDAVDAVCRHLLLEFYGPSSSQITGPVAAIHGRELSGNWFAISQSRLDAVLAELPALGNSDIRLAFSGIEQEIHATSDIKEAKSSSLTWRRYGRGLQVDAEAALKTRLIALAEEKAKKSEAETARRREAERAKQQATKTEQLPL
jgi:hypothetical protein